MLGLRRNCTRCPAVHASLFRPSSLPRLTPLPIFRLVLPHRLLKRLLVIPQQPIQRPLRRCQLPKLLRLLITFLNPHPPHPTHIPKHRRDLHSSPVPTPRPTTTLLPRHHHLNTPANSPRSTQHHSTTPQPPRQTPALNPYRFGTTGDKPPPESRKPPGGSGSLPDDPHPLVPEARESAQALVPAHDERDERGAISAGPSAGSAGAAFGEEKGMLRCWLGDTGEGGRRCLPSLG